MNNLILKQPQSWQTSVGLPFFQIQGTVSQDHAHPMHWAISCLPLTRAACFAHCSWIFIGLWNGTKFASMCVLCSVSRTHHTARAQAHIPSTGLHSRVAFTPSTGVPYEGTSRMTTSLKRRHRDRVVRRVSRRFTNPTCVYPTMRLCLQSSHIPSLSLCAFSGHGASRGTRTPLFTDSNRPPPKCIHSLGASCLTHSLIIESDFYATEAGRQHFSGANRSFRTIRRLRLADCF